MLHLRCWFAMLMCVTLAALAQAKADVWPAALEGFLYAMQDQRMVRMEIVHMTTLTLTSTQLDSAMFDGSVNEEVYAKQPNANCYAALDGVRRARILSEFGKYPIKFTRDRTDINWRILLLDAKSRVWHNIYIGQIYDNAQEVLMIVDGQMMSVDRRFVEFLDQDKTLNRCHF